MATNKNQHFVPRCHLRPFTLNEGDAAINVFNLDRNQFFPNAPVKNQCSRDYFYGQDKQLEAAISHSERAYAAVLREIRAPRAVVNEQHKSVLRRFWLLQHRRTEAASRRAMEIAAEADAVAGIEAMSFKFDTKKAVQFAMRNYAAMIDSVDDLKVCLIRNRTQIPFITSDDPAVLANRWYLEDSRIIGNSFGVQSSGLLALLPLTPWLLLVAYDGDVYSVSHEHGFADVRRPADVFAFNQHQILNCFSNLYLHDLEHSGVLRAQVAVALPHRLQSRHAIHIAVEDKTEGDYTRYRVVTPSEAQTSGEKALLLHLETMHPKPLTWPVVVRWRSPGSVYTNGTGLKYVRKRYALSLNSHRTFRREVAR